MPGLGDFLLGVGQSLEGASQSFNENVLRPVATAKDYTDLWEFAKSMVTQPIEQAQQELSTRMDPNSPQGILNTLPMVVAQQSGLLPATQAALSENLTANQRGRLAGPAALQMFMSAEGLRSASSTVESLGKFTRGVPEEVRYQAAKLNKEKLTGKKSGKTTLDFEQLPPDNKNIKFTTENLGQFEFLENKLSKKEIEDFKPYKVLNDYLEDIVPWINDKIDEIQLVADKNYVRNKLAAEVLNSDEVPVDVLEAAMKVTNKSGRSFIDAKESGFLFDEFDIENFQLDFSDIINGKRKPTPRKLPVSKEGIPFDHKQVLKERLKILNEDPTQFQWSEVLQGLRDSSWRREQDAQKGATVRSGAEFIVSDVEYY